MPTAEVTAGYVGRPITNQAPVIKPNVEAGKWELFGRAVLGFHRRVASTAMCQCNRTLRECDIWAQAQQYGIVLPPQ